MRCRQFILSLEDFLAGHPGAVPEQPPALLAAHAGVCAACAARWRQAAHSREMLAVLARPTALDADPAFVTRVGAAIRARQRELAQSGWHGWVVARRDLALALLLLVTACGTLLYNLDQPAYDATEAMVLDVPHWHPQHPAADHERPNEMDAMLDLLGR